ncbi:MAG: thiamine-phosphate kinase [Candidatus Omnitrophota bacterium]
MKELEFIKKIQISAKKLPGDLVLGIGDDCAVMEKDKNTFFVWGSDMITEGTHFRIKDGYERIGRKSVAVNISDVAAMGGRPMYITVSIGMPYGMKASDALKIYKGISGIAGEYGIQLAGGDTVRSEKLVIDVSIIGKVLKKDLVTRSGAREGDLVLITGPVRNGRKEHLDFIPRISESRFLVKYYKPGAMIDVSDGIASDMGRICMESGTGCILFEKDIPLSAGLSMEDAMHYGESFELLFTMEKKKAEKLISRRKGASLPGFFVIGKITAASQGIKIMRSSGRTADLEMRCYDHFGNSRSG